MQFLKLSTLPFVSFFTATLLSCSVFLYSDVAEDFLKGVFTEGITVDLSEPTMCEGVLTTETGGVINGPGIRIQARKLSYTRKKQDGQPLITIKAEEDLMVEFGDTTFVGSCLEYDFQTGSGVLYEGCTSHEPWFIGGKWIKLCSDGSYIIHDAFVTTSESCDADWMLTAEKTTLQGKLLEANDVRFHISRMPLLWLPSYKIDLDAIYDDPISYSVGWGGREGPRFGMRYEVFSWNRLKTFLRLDYRLNRGPGGGIETSYRSADHKTMLETINYMARDSSIFIKHERFRYRFQGAFSTAFDHDKTTLDLTYDKLSDKDMATDYLEQSLDLEIDGRTQLDIRRQERNWIGNLMTRVRVNSFETVKQQLPTFRSNWRPFQLGSTGIISENQMTASYLNFVYATHQPHVHNYDSSRVQFSPRLYRPFHYGSLIITPQAGGEVVFYGNTPHAGKRWLFLGLFETDANIPFYRFYGNKKHVVTPYARYQYYTFPTISPKEHYIFDIEDGLYRYDRLRFGATQSLYFKDCDGNISRYLYADLYANAFFDTRTLPPIVPKTYADIVFRFTPTLKHTLCTAWDFWKHKLDHINFRTEWTVSTDFAISAEYRHRSPYAWRKANQDNFILESFRCENRLHHSQLSDRRDTALLHFFYRFNPRWALEFESRHGWNRKHSGKTRFNEVEIDLHANLGSATKIKFAYQHNEAEDRIALYFSVGLARPDFSSPDIIPNLEF